MIDIPIMWPFIHSIKIYFEIFTCNNIILPFVQTWKWKFRLNIKNRKIKLFAWNTNAYPIVENIKHPCIFFKYEIYSSLGVLKYYTHLKSQNSHFTKNIEVLLFSKYSHCYLIESIRSRFLPKTPKLYVHLKFYKIKPFLRKHQNFTWL